MALNARLQEPILTECAQLSVQAELSGNQRLELTLAYWQSVEFIGFTPVSTPPSQELGQLFVEFLDASPGTIRCTVAMPRSCLVVDRLPTGSYT
jgi:hypothetical protein